MIKHIDGDAWIRYSDFLQLKQEFEEVKNQYVMFEAASREKDETIRSGRDAIIALEGQVKSLREQLNQSLVAADLHNG